MWTPPPPHPPQSSTTTTSRRRNQAGPGEDAGDLSRAALILQAFQRAAVEKTIRARRRKKAMGRRKEE
ncbi:hypothetical protein AKJ16_DCAP22598 [Drosera capensis]